LSSDPETSAIFEEFYGIIDVNGDGEITTAEIEQIGGAVGINDEEIFLKMNVLFSINIIYPIFFMKWLKQRMIKIHQEKCIRKMRMKISMKI
jgi:hypothetical protein